MEEAIEAIKAMGITHDEQQIREVRVEGVCVCVYLCMCVTKLILITYQNKLANKHTIFTFYVSFC